MFNKKTDHPRGSKKLIGAWTLYDWANSVYSLVISSAIFPIYYSQYIFSDTNSVMFFDLDINFESLPWKEVPERDTKYTSEYFEMENKFYESRDEVSTKFREKKQTKPQEGLSISDAKKEISKYYGIPEEGIEIILRG